MKRISMLLRAVLIVGLSISMAACASTHFTHSTDDLVESGAFKVAATGTESFHVEGVRVFKDTDGLHVHGFVKRWSVISGHIEIALLDQSGAVLYERILKPNELESLHAGHKSPTSSIKNEKFNISLGNISVDRGTVRVLFHQGVEHDVKKP
ncbi:MAG: hypothetical protein HQL80_03885 [Magnetococcales bacterium]|nr:hypothetical protein [Magnetococcales bacterium]